jgi:RNA polymerase sigma-70 factor (ECF subfamily)
VATDNDQVTQLAKSAGRGDQAALSAFIQATQRDVWRLIAYLTDPGTADDLTHETFARAVGALPRFAGRSTARTWLLSIARRVVVDSTRHNASRRRTHTADHMTYHMTDQALAGGRAWDKRVSRVENMVEIRTLIDGLDAARREALVLTQILGLSYAEAAEVCGCPIGTVRSRLARARDDLLRAADESDCAG